MFIHHATMEKFVLKVAFKITMHIICKATNLPTSVRVPLESEHIHRNAIFFIF